MKNLIKSLHIVLFSAFLTVVFVTCKKSDDPANNDFFAGTYRGSISYANGTSNISNTTTGKVFVTKIASGTKYNFAFSDNIPDLNGME